MDNMGMLVIARIAEPEASFGENATRHAVRIVRVLGEGGCPPEDVILLLGVATSAISDAIKAEKAGQ